MRQHRRHQPLQHLHCLTDAVLSSKTTSGATQFAMSHRHCSFVALPARGRVYLTAAPRATVMSAGAQQRKAAGFRAVTGAGIPSFSACGSGLIRRRYGLSVHRRAVLPVLYTNHYSVFACLESDSAARRGELDLIRSDLELVLELLDLDGDDHLRVDAFQSPP